MHLLDLALAKEVVKYYIVELETLRLVHSQTKHRFQEFRDSVLLILVPYNYYLVAAELRLV